ncbi:MAG: HAMP domain-containing protein [Planctomycetes bacterium]|nr:HAMP domain-containing protein [Planctomycetota bacterium]
MKFSIGQKIGISVAAFTLLVIVCAVVSTISMWSIHKDVQMITSESFPLVIAAEEMYSSKAAARLELLRYLNEVDESQLGEIEKKYRNYLAAHDRFEDAIGKVVSRVEENHTQIRKVWEDGMATIMPAFERHAKGTMENHRKYLAVKFARIEKMEEHEKLGKEMLSRLSDMQKNNKGKESVVSIAADLKMEHMWAMFSDEEYITKGAFISTEELAKIRKAFEGYGNEFEKSLLALGKILKKSYNLEAIKEIRRVFDEFSFSALGQEQLFELFKAELSLQSQGSANLAAVDAAGLADWEMANEIVGLTKKVFEGAEVMAARRAGSVTNKLIAFCIIAFLLCLFITRNLSVKIVRPIEALSLASMEVASGNFSHRVESSSQDEVGQLCNCFNRMSEELETETKKRKDMEQDKEYLLRKLEEKNRELQSVVYVASHDLKSPLVTINGFSEEVGYICNEIKDVIENGGVDESVREKLAGLLNNEIPEDLRFISAGTTKMQTLIDGLLQVSRVGTIEVEIEPLNLNEILHSIENVMQYKIKSKGVNLTIEDVPGCTGDANLVNQVFSNLIDNALKYLDPDREGTIHVWGRENGVRCVYCVEDNGVGIDERNQDRVFELFHRLKPDSEETGEGLGLTIVSRILERLDGSIWLESKAGEGSRFFLSLPKS